MSLETKPRQGGRPPHSDDGLVERHTERQLPQGVRPSNTVDGPVEVTPHRQVSQGGRPHDPNDGLVEVYPPCIRDAEYPLNKKCAKLAQNNCIKTKQCRAKVVSDMVWYGERAWREEAGGAHST